MSLPIGSKVALLRSSEVLTKDNVAAELGITTRSASNLLQRWANEGILHRTAPGEYMSSFANVDDERRMLETIVKRVGTKLILVGASAWKRVGWCDSPLMHVAIPHRPSRAMPRIRNVVLYPIGAKAWMSLAKTAVQVDLDKPPIIHPIAQMLWWMDEIDSPVEMPAPHRINWEILQGEPDFAAAVLGKWPELSGTPADLNVAQLYTMMYGDRLRGVIPGGRAEPAAGYAEDDGRTSPSHDQLVL